jgi:hypothetical protein
MLHSIFDPTSGEPERSGSMFTPPDADQISHLPDYFTESPATAPDGKVGFAAPLEQPALAVRAESDGKLLIVTMIGRLQQRDYANFVSTVDAAVSRHGKVRILLEMHNFHGWSLGAAWEDLKFDLRHFNHIERVAIVGEAPWEMWLGTFFKPFTRATIMYFPKVREANAHAWITAG